MRDIMIVRGRRVLALAALAAVVSGCNLTGAMEPPAAFPTGTASGTAKKQFQPNSEAGLPVTPDADAAKLTKYVARENAVGAFGVARSDPFALTPQEKGFETVQTTERFFGSAGGFSVQVTPKPVVEDQVVPEEPQPYRRLSGIVVGDSILAILEEQGREPVIVTPGMQLPNSPWRVVSIDQDKAVLRRSGKARPSEVTVRLEVPAYGTQPGGGAGAIPGGGYPGGGYPGGGYPGGGPGGRGGRGGNPGMEP